ncbi:MAG TPA: efflux RND transporter periplasmic adaptor subunit [Verrucomicrobiales bacterium]|nr:efflux RND transporter periplasmic adaptor subunit [Verrucomicrobiales bacterium]
MRRLLHGGLAVAVVGVAVLLAWWFYATEQKPPKRPMERPPAVVQTMVLRPGTEEVRLKSRGTVRPRTESTLIPEVAGQILRISPALRSGGFFEKDDILLEIDARDYETALVVAQAELARAEALVVEEQARADQAREDWERLGDGSAPTPLALRVPQLAEARANVESAGARVEKARRDLQRTKIPAPYPGRVMEKMVDVGQFVNTGTLLAHIYEVDVVEVRLPLTNEQLAHIDLPELYRGQQDGWVDGPPVKLFGSVAGRRGEWEGKIVRVEGAIDLASRQLYVVAQVDDPYRQRGDHPPLKIGQFVEARIEGNNLEGVFRVPRQAVRENNVVYVLDPELFEPYIPSGPPGGGRGPGGGPQARAPARGPEAAVLAMERTELRRREVEIAYSDEDHVLVSGGLQSGEILCLTPLPFAADGTPVVTSRAEPNQGGAAETAAAVPVP